MAHHLFSQKKDRVIMSFDTFDKVAIKTAIIEMLKECPEDTIEHCKDYPKRALKKFYGYNIVNFYEVNPNNGKPSLVVTKGGKEYYRSLIN